MMMENKYEQDKLRSTEDDCNNTIIAIADVDPSVHVSTKENSEAAAASESNNYKKNTGDILISLLRRRPLSLWIVIILLFITISFNFHYQHRHRYEDEKDMGNLEYYTTCFVHDGILVSFSSIVFPTIFWIIIHYLGLYATSWSSLKGMYGKNTLLVMIIVIGSRCFSKLYFVHALFSILFAQFWLKYIHYSHDNTIQSPGTSSELRV
jgi:hypothetical protein